IGMSHRFLITESIDPRRLNSIELDGSKMKISTDLRSHHLLFVGCEGDERRRDFCSSFPSFLFFNLVPQLVNLVTH
ncbi:predicted protein, partial [Arabidopsis lyrata subsp. lyrata]